LSLQTAGSQPQTCSTSEKTPTQADTPLQTNDDSTFVAFKPTDSSLQFSNTNSFMPADNSFDATINDLLESSMSSPLRHLLESSFSSPLQTESCNSPLQNVLFSSPLQTDTSSPPANRSQFQTNSPLHTTIEAQEER